MPFKKGHKIWLGKKLSDETKKKISAALIGVNTWSVGRRASDETRRKISEANKRNPFWLGKKFSDEHRKNISESHKGLNIWMKGRKLSDNTKDKISDFNKGKHTGEKSNFWKGGISSINAKIRGSIEYKLWEDSIFARDGYTCQRCHQTLMPYKLVGHHILNFSSHIELRMAIDNGITFCKGCHRQFHRKYGIKNNTREQLEEFLKN